MPIFFDSPAAFRAWLEQNAATAPEVIVGYHKVHTGLPSLSWPQSVDEALCFGWIDGIRRSLGADAYQIRFTPRRPNSTWSAVNIARVAELTKENRMTPAGLAAFARRIPEKSAIYAYENAIPTLEPELQTLLDSHPTAAAFFATRTDSYRRKVLAWITSGRALETRRRRLLQAIDSFSKNTQL